MVKKLEGPQDQTNDQRKTRPNIKLNDQQSKLTFDEV